MPHKPDATSKTDAYKLASTPKSRSMETTASIFSDDKRIIGLLYANTKEYFLLIDTQLNIQMFNQVTYRHIKDLIGIEIKQGTSVLDLAPPDRREALVQLYAAVLSGAIKESESVLTLPDKEPAIFKNSFSPARDETGAIVAVMVSATDITHQRKQEIELREAEERWRFALEGSNLGLWDWNLQTGDMYFSSSYKKLYGFEEDELTNNSDEWTSRIHPDDKHLVTNAVSKHTASANPYYETTYRIQDKASNYRWIVSKGMLVSKDKEGTPLRMIGTHTDITEQKKAEEALKESHERFKLAAIATSEALWEWDIENSRIYNSPVFKDLFGFDVTPDGAFADWNELIHPDDREETVKSYYDIIADPRVDRWEKEYRYRKADGDYLYVSDRCVILRNSQGKAIKVVGALQDITKRKMAEEEAAKISERFKYASKATSDAIYDWNIETDNWYWGEGLMKLFGHSPKSFKISIWETLLHPDDRSDVTASLNATLQNFKKRHWKQEYRLQRTDGGYSFVLERGFIVRDDEGKAIRMIGALQDISDLKEKEQQLWQSNERYVLATKATSDAIWDWNLTTDEVVWSEGMTKLFGHPSGVSSISSWTEGVHSNEREAVEKSIHYAIEHKKKKHWKSEYRFLHKDGTYRFVFDRGFIVRDEKGNAIRMIGAMQDITGRKEKEQQLLESNERFDIVIKATNDLIWDWNLETGAFYRDKEGIRKVYGVNNESEIATIYAWLQRVHPDDHNGLQETINAILHASDQNTFEAEYRFRKDDGEYVHIHDRGLLIRNDQGQPVRLIGAAQNITERKNLEEQLVNKELNKQKIISQSTIETQERERAEIGKELHDNVNQILTTTKLYLDLSMTNPELKDDLIQKSSKNVIYVINEIRQLSRSLMNPSLGDLGLTDAIIDLIENINLTKKLQVSFKPNEKLEAHLSEAQKLMIFRITQEALNNAIRHARAGKASIMLKEKNGNICLTIKDDGIGFDTQSTRKGAGLKNIQNRVYLADGTLQIESKPHKGCSIIINFPIKPNCQ